MKNKETATVTWITFNNFGTYLQAFALQKIIKDLGYNNKIISDKKVLRLQKTSKELFIIYLKNIYHILKALFIPEYKKFLNVSSFYKQFAIQYLDIDYNWENAASLDTKYDMFICGSDQIWSPNNVFSPFYYLGFTNKKKISYAPSMGTSDYPQEIVKLAKPYLDKISALSVRETQGCKILKEKFDLDAKVVVDPTLLLEKKDWEEFVNKTRNDNYVLAYLLTYNTSYLNFIREFANAKGLPLKIFVVNDTRVCDIADESLFVGPKDFLDEIYNSTYFFTDSFHGTIFGIHFEKTFFTLKRFEDSMKLNQNIRITNLFDRLNLQEYFLSEKSLTNAYTLPNINYPEVKKQISIDRDNSLNFLRTALNI